jgi:hypothetical protein
MIGLDQGVIVVGEDAPGKGFGVGLTEDFQKAEFKIGEAFRGMADDGFVFVAGGGEVVEGACALAMRRAVKWMAFLFAGLECGFSLLRGHFSPLVHGGASGF